MAGRWIGRSARVSPVFAALFLAPWSSTDAPTPVGSESVAFETLRVDLDRSGDEPLLGIRSNNEVWIAGTNDGDANLWKGLLDGAWAFALVDPQPPIRQGLDATIHLSAAPWAFWTLTGGQVTTRSVADPAAAWTPVRSLDVNDRPWFFSTAADTFEVASSVAPRPLAAAHLYRWVPAFAAWEGVVTVADGADYIATGFPRATPAGTLAVPVSRAVINRPPYTVSLAYSEDNGATWEEVGVPGANDVQTLPWSATDAGGNIYVAWGTADRVKYAAFRPSHQWVGPVVVGEDDRVWGPAAVALSAGRLGVAWYGSSNLLGIPQDWTVRYNLVTAADTFLPVLERPANDAFVVEAGVADAGQTGRGAFRDFLSAEALPNGNAVIAYVCAAAVPGDCGAQAALGHKTSFAHQTAGPRL